MINPKSNIFYIDSIEYLKIIANASSEIKEVVLRKSLFSTEANEEKINQKFSKIDQKIFSNLNDQNISAFFLLWLSFKEKTIR